MHLTYSEAAEWLRVSRWTVRRLVKSRELAVASIRGSKRIPIASVKAFLTRHTVTATSANGAADAPR